jgi:hypothetical protein
MTGIETTVLSGEELRTCRFRRLMPNGEWCAPETHTDLRGAPIGEKVLLWEYDRLVRPARRARRPAAEHITIMYCAEGWHSTTGTADAPDDPEPCSTMTSRKWRKRGTGREPFRPFWEFHQKHPVVWIVKTTTQEPAGHRRIAYCDPELPAEYRTATRPDSRVPSVAAMATGTLDVLE